MSTLTWRKATPCWCDRPPFPTRAGLSYGATGVYHAARTPLRPSQTFAATRSPPPPAHGPSNFLRPSSRPGTRPILDPRFTHLC